MAKNKGKPSGKFASTKKDPGRQGDLKEIGAISGARKKTISKAAGIRAVTGTAGGRKG
jgi:hypothetical protein